MIDNQERIKVIVTEVPGRTGYPNAVGMGGLTRKVKERRRLPQDSSSNRARSGGETGGDGGRPIYGTVAILREMAYRLSVVKKSEGMMPPGLHAVRGCRR